MLDTITSFENEINTIIVENNKLLKRALTMRLFIIGNGFDLNHGYKTDYGNFRKFLSTHDYSIFGIDLSQYFPVEDPDLWNDFENELEFIDFEEATDYIVGNFTDDMSDKEWDREYSRNSALLDSFAEAPANIYPALCQALSDFICKEYRKNSPNPKKYFESVFADDSIFITFNYTKTLEDTYKIQNERINHIHGIAYEHIFHKDDLVDVGFDEPSIVFGHANTRKYKYEEIDPSEFDAMIPNRCLRNMNQYLEKKYQLNSLEEFIKNNSIESVEIIGHDLGIVDDPYFELLNKYLLKNAIIKYWIWDEKKESDKRKKLEELFPSKNIEMLYYPDEE